ncbi:WXG100 family type VII secretion target [Streptomyces orinoci]|uniref:WXG100 family type VII secretion target n=1 Tax=Streptomyces orinoci TaxID=67339 RepID=A0ABV3K2I9_STRON|nr:hypothetical protein [Streptomyces orinoci]
MSGNSDKDADLHIRAADLKASAPTFHEQSKALHDAAATLKSTLDGLGSPWGDDDPGKKFHDSYGPGKTSIDKAVDILVQGLQSISVAMTTMAEGHAGNDHDIAAIFKKAAKQMQGNSHGNSK